MRGVWKQIYKLLATTLESFLYFIVQPKEQAPHDGAHREKAVHAQQDDLADQSDLEEGGLLAVTLEPDGAVIVNNSGEGTGIKVKHSTCSNRL